MAEAIDAVVAPGPLLPDAPRAARYREFHVKPASVLAAGDAIVVGGLGGVACRAQLGLVFAPTPAGTPAERILDTLRSVRLVIELIAPGRLAIGWEGPRWHIRYAEGVAFDGACRAGDPADAAALRSRETLELEHPEGRDTIRWTDLADAAAFVNRGLELDPRTLVLAGSGRGPVLELGGARPELGWLGRTDLGPGEVLRIAASGLGSVEYRLEGAS